MADYKSIFTKEGAATSSDVALSISDLNKKSNWVFRNTHGSQDLTVKIHGFTLTVGSGETYECNIVAAPTQITVATNLTTYRIQGFGY